jgi:hypothetical protein
MAKKKTPAELAAEGAELAKIIATARKRDHNFAMLIGKEGIVLAADPKKPAATMRRQAKAEGGGAKGAQGIMRVSGKVIEFHCEEESPPKMLGKMAKVHFKERGQAYKVVIMTPAGEMGDEDGAGEGEEQTRRERREERKEERQEERSARRGEPEEASVTTPEPTPEPTPVPEPTPEPVAEEVPNEPSDGALAALREKLMADFLGIEPSVESAKNSDNKGLAKKAGKLSELFKIELENDLAKAGKILTLLGTTVAGIAEAAVEAVKEAVLPYNPDRTGRADVATLAQMDVLAAANPEAGAAAMQALRGFDATLGEGTVVTKELMATFDAARIAAEARAKIASDMVKAAEAMTDGPEKDAAIAAANAQQTAANSDLEQAQGNLRAAKGKLMLTEAITTGPLSPSAPRPFEDATAAEFVEAFARRPDTAQFAMETASRSQNPDAIGAGMDMLCDNLENGFAASDGRMPPDGFAAEDYAQNLIRGAGAEGGEYMQAAGSYIESGQHLVSEPIPVLSGETSNGLERDRSNYMSTSVMDRNGQIDLTTDKAQQALGHLRFNPDVIDTPTPDLNNHVAGTYEMLAEPANATRAQEILDNTDAPTGAGSAMVSRTFGGVAGPFQAIDTQQAVMSAMMTPVHQGGVGSCFATAGVRRMRETDPMESMQRYSEMAETGQFNPRNGEDAIPAVTSFPLDENPLIRSMEYSAATVMAGMAGNSRNDVMQNSMTATLANLQGVLDDNSILEQITGIDDWPIEQSLIRGTLKRSFMVEYDAITPTGLSPDGSSTRGGYMLIQIEPTPNKVIDTEAKFVDALVERVMFAIGETSAEREVAVRTAVSGRPFLDSLLQGKKAPWELGGGGMPAEADNVLFGDNAQNDWFIGTRTATGPLASPTDGARTTDVLEGVLNVLGNSNADMVPLMNWGVHAFNGLPDHPSLAPLLEGGNFAQNVQDHLVDVGTTIAATDLEPHQGQEVFDEIIGRIRSYDSDAGRATVYNAAYTAGITAEARTPREIIDAIHTAFAAYYTRLSTELAADWQAREVAAGRPCTDNQRDTVGVPFYLDRVREVVETQGSHSLADQVPLPVFTIADTNWGDATHTVNFVMAPDPVSGEPRMWKQYLPAGDMVMMSDKYTDRGWAEVQTIEAGPPAGP